MEFVTFTIIIDDIVYPDGHTAMCCLGGGGPQTAFGMKVWASDEERIGLGARIGSDFPASCREWLEKMKIDVSGLLPWPYPTLRAWQVLEEDGRRGQVWRVELGEEVWAMLRPTVKELPPPYRKAKAYHACVHPSSLDKDFMQELRDTGAAVVSIEPYTHAEDILTRVELQALVTGGHIFSPNEVEAVSLVGPGPPLDLVDRLVELGAKVVSLRRGHLGCLVHRADTGETWEVPAIHEVEKGLPRARDKRWEEAGMIGVVDPTGCGNSFCGGFLAGWVQTRDLLTAALCGSVAASFMVEHEGVPQIPLLKLKSQADARFQLLRGYAKQLRLG
ncbi:hypothetical protein R1sor_018815 [Riccia sorocarpa]|uniref:Carbohydrate kinase PfkB domain-containing protein n=1 Tax=Riccia sorocarpa TaxID=122646 RepID=A0ABD3IAR7_9MARC